MSKNLNNIYIQNYTPQQQQIVPNNLSGVLPGFKSITAQQRLYTQQQIAMIHQQQKM